MDKRRQMFIMGLASMVWLLAGCNRGANDSHDVEGPLYPLNLAFVCDPSTPTVLKGEYPTGDSPKGLGQVCVERHFAANSLNLSKVEIHQDKAFREPVYEIRLYVDRKDQERMQRVMIKAIRSHRTIAFVVDGSVFSQALVMGPPKEGVITVGGYSSVAEAKTAAARFEVPIHH